MLPPPPLLFLFFLLFIFLLPPPLPFFSSSSFPPLLLLFPKTSTRSYLSLASNITRERVPLASCSSTPNTASTSLRHHGGYCVMSYAICRRWTLTCEDIHLNYILLPRLSGPSIVTDYCKQQTLGSEVSPLQSGSGGLLFVSLGVSLCMQGLPCWHTAALLLLQHGAASLPSVGGEGPPN